MYGLDNMFVNFILWVIFITAIVVSLGWWLLPKLWAWLIPIIHAATA